MTFIPYSSPKGTVDLVEADRAFEMALERQRENMRRITTRWVSALQFIAGKRPEMHWCAYADGRVVAFIELERDESFHDLTEIYNFVSGQVEHLEKLGNYKGEFVAEPDPEDHADIQWRVWVFRAGDSALHLNCGFAGSRHCKWVEDGEEVVVMKKRRVVCDGGLSL